MTIEFAQSPSIHAIMDRHRPTRRPGTRVIRLDDPLSLSLQLAKTAASDLADPSVAMRLDAGEIATLAAAADSTKRELGDDGGLGAAVKQLLTKCSHEIIVEYVLAAIADHGRYGGLLKSLPGIESSPAMVAALVEAMRRDNLGRLDSIIDVDLLVVRDLNEARQLLPLAGSHARDFIASYLVAAMERGMGWTPWVKLFAILFESTELAFENAPSKPPERDRFEPERAKRIRDGVWNAIRNDDAVRLVARLLLDLDSTLAAAGPDVSGVYLSRLRNAVGGNVELRQAAIEALLWRPERQRDLALFTATQLTKPEDEQFVRSLTAHPDRRAGYAAEMLVDAVFGTMAGEVWPRPSIAGIGAGLFRLQLDPPPDEEPLTWIGDRLLERIIERTIDGEERRFAASYSDHSEEGEEGLLRQLFADLANRFRNLDAGLHGAALATGANRGARIDLSYRPVDKSEEGKPGIHRDDKETPPAFSADVCLIVDPHLDGRPLGKRATLVQAKRLRLKNTDRPGLGYRSSFVLDPAQMDDLTRQTASSHYLFQCPGLRARGIPIVPTQLVKDFARHHAPTAAQVSTAIIGAASQSFAHWLTYEVLALRVGDPLEELVVKAEGGEGRSPRHLARFGTLEVTVRVEEQKSKER